MAIIDHFRRRGAMVIATTHYDALKSYASTTEGVMAAGFGFDPADVRADLPAELRLAGQQPRARDRQPARACRPTSSSRRGRSAARASRSSPSTSPRSSATCRRSITSAGSRRASGRRWRRRRRSCTRASRSCATARRRSGAGSTSGSRSGCATRGARSTRWSTR